MTPLLRSGAWLLPLILLTPGALPADALSSPQKPIVLDGRLDPTEWSLESAEVPPGGDVHLRSDARFVWVGVRGNIARTVHLYLAGGEEIHVLHASGSLGRAVYRRSGEVWEPASAFAWQVRDPSIRRPTDPPDVEAERREHLTAQGWTANTVMMGTPGQVEIQLDRAYLERQGQSLAVSYFWQDAGKTRIVHWPGDAEVAPEEENLLNGETGPARFTTLNWHSLKAAPFAAFAARLEALSREHKLPGLAAAIVQDGKLSWSQGYGIADEDREVPVTPDTPFWIASVTKPFIGHLFLLLEAAGRISLDDRINDVPKWDGFCGWLSTSTLPFGRDLRCATPITIRNILNHTVNGAPGTHFLYNPVMYSRLSRYIEHKSGRSVDWVEGRQNTMAQLMEEKILGPAGMARTMASQWQREKALVFFDMAQGMEIDAEGSLIKKPRPERELAGGAGIVSTVEDLARYDIALDSGKLASKAVMEKLFTPAKAPDGTVLPYAFGWYVQQDRGETLVWHAGLDEDAGFSALYLKVPARRLTLILLANGPGLSWGNPLDRAEVEKSPFASEFLDRFVWAGQN